MALDVPGWLGSLAEEIGGVRGVEGVVLGGSVARGDGKPDSDLDLGVFYRASSFDWDGLAEVARRRDDAGKPRGMAKPGEWGPWVNGGIWLTVNGRAVDFLLRDFEAVERVVEDCKRGIVTSHYQIGHPSAWHSYIWMSEAHHNVPLFDPRGELQALRARTHPFPAELRAFLVDRFLSEARFTRWVMKKLKSRADNYYSAGLAFRFCSCILQVLFALNETYFVNEKGSVEATEQLARAPVNVARRLQAIMAAVPELAERGPWLESIEAVFGETEALCGNLVVSGGDF
jgi:hypothetical protein